MCGICGVLGNPNGVHPEWEPLVHQMMEKIAHRGPDAEGCHIGSSFAIGHKRLSIIDIDSGKQPMFSADGRYVIVFNGEIYNYLELRQSLIQQGVSFRTFSDTEVLLQMLIHKGADALNALNGMFAFTFIDQQTHEWIIARDPFGIKPLYYSEVRDELIFASEIKALLLHPDLSANVNWKGLQHYMTFQFCLNDATLFQGVRKLEPGCYLQGSGSSIKQCVRYWDTCYQIDGYHTEEYYSDRLRSLLEESVHLQIRSDVPLGAYLSGGIDSSVISMLAAGHLQGNMKVFHGRFEEGPQYDESYYAKLVANECGGEMLSVAPTAGQFVEDMPRLIYAMDEPVAGPGLFPQYRVSKLASEHVKVVLGGQGGDEVFGGYARYLVGYLEQALKGGIFETQEEGEHVVTLASIIENLPVLKQYHPLMQHFWKDNLFGEMDARYFRLIDRSPDLANILTDDALESMDPESVFADFQSVFNHPDTKSYINKMTHFDVKTLLPALLQVEDRVSMAVSLESRVPILDTRIVDLVCSIPPPMKFKGGKTKYIFKDVVKNLIPRELMERKDKMGFPVPLKEWMQKGPVRDFVGDVLLSQASRQRGLFKPDALENLIRKETAFGRQLWGALCLELWHQQFIDH
jgi:asparagine synthase (glutamine-hydrolysing)